MNATAAIRADALSRVFGDRVAVGAVSFDVAPGKVFGFLGLNGAGKSTTVFLAPHAAPRVLAHRNAVDRSQ